MNIQFFFRTNIPTFGTLIGYDLKKRKLVKISSMKRHRWRIVLPIVLIGLSVWVVSRWNAWFYIPEEPAYTPSAVPGRVLLTFGDGNEDSRNVSWQCDTILKPSYVELRLGGDDESRTFPADGEVFASRSGKSAYYVARLRSLLPDTCYHYRVITGEEKSAWHTFRTYPFRRDKFSFIYIGDVQDTINGKTNILMKKAFSRFPDAEFLVSGGDLTERPSDNYWAESFRSLDSLAQTLPLLGVTGNHDYLKTLPRSLERRFSLIYSYFLDSKEDDNHVYSLRYGDAEFFLLDSNREFNFLWEQRKWLEKKLSESSARWKILVLHHPLYSIKGSTNNLIQRWIFADLIENNRVDLVLQGHEHAYARMNKQSDEGMSIAPLYLITHCSTKHYRIEFNPLFSRLGIGGRYFQKIDVAHDTLTLATYEASSGMLYDSLLVVKQPQGGVARVVDCASGIPEDMHFKPREGSRKDKKYMEAIRRYMEEHPEKTFRY